MQETVIVVKKKLFKMPYQSWKLYIFYRIIKRLIRENILKSVWTKWINIFEFNR